MSETEQRNEMTARRVVYAIEGMQSVLVERDIAYRTTEAGMLGMDVYRPKDAGPGERLPAVLFVTGYPDPGFEAMVGCKIKEMEGYVSWAELVAASGLVAVTYANQEPVADLGAVARHIRANAATLGIDEQRLGAWACSGNVPNALSLLMRDAAVPLRSAVLCYGPMLDWAGTTAVADGARQFGYANPCSGRTALDLAPELPLMIVRAGQDEMPGLNASIDRFVAEALAQNLPLSLVNHPQAPHAFDLVDDTESTREVVRRILAFLRFHLLG